MAIDFNKSPEKRSSNGNPFGDSGSSGRNMEGFGNGPSAGKHSGGFNFGGSGKPSGINSGSIGFEKRQNSGNTGGSGFNFGSKPDGTGAQDQKRNGFANLPAIQSENRASRPGNVPVRSPSMGSSFSSADIPWKAIIYVLLTIVVLVLVVYFWDVITYVITNIIVMLFLIIILLLVIRWLLRPRR